MGQMNVAKQATEDITAFLLSLPYTQKVINVEDDRAFQKKDIDLVWHYHYKGIDHVKTIEIKGDTYSYSPNFFFETISNKTKQTPGCFMYSEADYFFYYFVGKRELNIIPLQEARTWFLTHQASFEMKTLATGKLKVGGTMYETEGALIPKTRIRQALTNIRTFTI